MSFNQPDVKKINSLWHDASDLLLQTLSAQGEILLNKTSPLESWSMAQVGDHLLKSFNLDAILNGATEKPTRDFDEKVAIFWEVFENDEIKMSSPEAILPKGGIINKEKLLESLQQKINEIKKVIETKDLSKLCLNYAIPEYGYFTRWEWITFAIVHTERHVRQMKRIFEKVNT
ncbi:MAG: DinB family protein [Ginsengibacter sp.]